MRTALIFLAIGILLLLFFYSRVDVWFAKSTIDIHFHDTYYVVSRPEIILLTIAFLGSLSALGGSIGTRFRNKFFVIALTIFLLVDIYILWSLYSLFH